MCERESEREKMRERERERKRGWHTPVSRSHARLHAAQRSYATQENKKKEERGRKQRTHAHFMELRRHENYSTKIEEKKRGGKPS